MPFTNLQDSTSTFWNFFELCTQTLGAKKPLYLRTANHRSCSRNCTGTPSRKAKSPNRGAMFVSVRERENEYSYGSIKIIQVIYLPKQHHPRLSTHFLGVLPLHEIPTQPTWFSFSPKLFITFQLIPWHHKLASDLTIPKLREKVTTFPIALLIGSPLVMWYLTLFILKTFVEFWKFMRIWMWCTIHKLLFRCFGMDWLLMKMTLVGQTIQTKRPETREGPRWKWLANKNYPQKFGIDTQKWPYSKGSTFSKPSFLGIHVSFRGCTS